MDINKIIGVDEFYFYFPICNEFADKGLMHFHQQS